MPGNAFTRDQPQPHPLSHSELWLQRKKNPWDFKNKKTLIWGGIKGGINAQRKESLGIPFKSRIVGKICHVLNREKKKRKEKLASC